MLFVTKRLLFSERRKGRLKELRVLSILALHRGACMQFEKESREWPRSFSVALLLPLEGRGGDEEGRKELLSFFTT